MKEARWLHSRRRFFNEGGKMRINIRYVKEKDIFEIQAIDKKLRAHFLLSRAELNNLRTLLEKALLDSRGKSKGKGNGKARNE